MPNWVKNQITNQEIIDALKAKKWLYEENGEDVLDFARIIPIQEDEDETEAWGCKWNASEVFLEYDFLEFNTPWSTPENIIEKISETFPNIEFKVEFADEDIGNNCGIFKASGGELSYIKPDDPLYFAARIWGEEDNYMYDQHDKTAYIEDDYVFFVDDREFTCMTIGYGDILPSDLENFYNSFPRFANALESYVANNSNYARKDLKDKNFLFNEYERIYNSKQSEKTLDK